MTEDKQTVVQIVSKLINLGKKNNKLEYDKILDVFSGVDISSEQFENILKILEDNEIKWRNYCLLPLILLPLLRTAQEPCREAHWLILLKEKGYRHRHCREFPISGKG